MAFDSLNRFLHMDPLIFHKRIILLILLCLPTSAVNAQSGLSNLKIGIGARSAGMGEAYTAVADDATATYWNPAGLTKIHSVQVLFFHNEWLQDIRSEFIAAVLPSDNYSIAFSLTSNNISDIEIRDERPSVEPLGTFTAHDIVISSSYARRLKDDLTLGISVKYVYQKIYVEESGGLAGDIGLMHRFKDWPIELGATLQNIGFMTRFREESPDLPTLVRFGVAIKPGKKILNQDWLFATDFISEFDGNSHLQLGMEVRLSKSFAVRTGYQTGYDIKDLHFGFGFKTNNMMLDYGYIPLRQDFGQGHRFSIAYNF